MAGVNTDIIRTILAGWNQGVENAAQREKAGQLNEQRQIENKLAAKQLEEIVKQREIENKFQQQSRDFATKQFDALEAAKRFEEANKVRDLVTQAKLDIPGLAKIQEQYKAPEGFIPNLGATGEITKAQADLTNQLIGGNVAAPTVGVGQGLNIDPRTFVTPEQFEERNPAAKLARAKEAQDLVQQKLAAEALAENKKLDRESRERLAQTTGEFRESVARIAAEGRADRAAAAAEGRAQRTEAANRDDAIRVSTNFTNLVSKYNVAGLRGDLGIGERAIKDPGKMNATEQFQLMYSFIKMADNKTGVKDAEFETVKTQMIAILDKIPLAVRKAYKGEVIPPEVRKMLGEMIQERGTYIKEQVTDAYTTSKNILKEIGIPEGRHGSYLLDPFRERGANATTPPPNSSVTVSDEQFKTLQELLKKGQK